MSKSKEKDNSITARFKESIKRLDSYEEVKNVLLPFCRLKKGEIWQDEAAGHRVGVLDATSKEDVARLLSGEKAKLIVNDPPYNIVVGKKSTKNLSKISLEEYLEFSKKWVENTISVMAENASLFVWIGADRKNGFQPFADFIILLRKYKELKSKNLITLRNQRGYGTQKNWMWVRQELLHYIKGNPDFNVQAEYTEIPRILKGYYKKVGGVLKETAERSASQMIRAGNVWVDIQQIFYKMEENVAGCYAQKPVKALERIIISSSDEGDCVLDLFSHSGTTLVTGEKTGRKVYTCDIDPIFAEITIRRLENFRKTGRLGWQWGNPFPEIEEKIINKYESYVSGKVRKVTNRNTSGRGKDSS